MTEFEYAPIVLDAAQRFVVAHGLPTDTPVVSAPDLVELLAWAAEHRLVGLVYEAARSPGPDVPNAITDAHIAMLRHGIGVEVAACRAVRVLRMAGVDAVVFKGVAAAHLDYPDPALRNFYDVDLLVSRVQLPVAGRCLERAGWSRVESKLGRGWEERFARAVQFVSPDGIELDLHAALAPGYFGVRLDHQRLLSSTEAFELGGVAMNGFSVDARLLVSSYALVLSRGGHVRLLRDVAQQLFVSQASPQRAAELAGDGDVILAAALQIVNRVIGLPPGVRSWMSSIPVDAAQRRGFALARRAHDDGWRFDAIGEMLALGAADRTRYVLGVASSRFTSRRSDGAETRSSVRNGARRDARTGGDS